MKISMKTVLSLFSVISLVLLAISSYAFGSSEIKWTSLKQVIEKAKIEKKPVIVDFFFGKGCPRCEVLEKTVYSSPAIAKKVMDDFIPIRIDLTKTLTAEEEKLGNQYDFKNDCLLLFLDHEGHVMKDPGGKRLCFIDSVEPEPFIKYLDYVRASIKAE